ncbi:MAG: hypothetical protein J6A12_01425 [Oscillospiraceae bacterium]|nr:hypothetical protein [Oscillospiraceae bacterium]
MGKNCEARPVDEKANSFWRSGQKFQGGYRRNFWEPQEGGQSRAQISYFSLSNRISRCSAIGSAPALGKNCEARPVKRVLWTKKRTVFGAAVKNFKVDTAEIFGNRKRADKAERRFRIFY